MAICNFLPPLFQIYAVKINNYRQIKDCGIHKLNDTVDHRLREIMIRSTTEFMKLS